jgi:hypothetical protein
MSFINCPFSLPCGSPSRLCYDKQVTNCYENPPKRLVICRCSLVYLYYRQGKRSRKSPNKKIKVENRLDKLFPFLYNGNNEANNTVGSLQGSRYTMSQIEIGQSFTTQKSGVSGTVQEVIKNANGSFRVRLDVNGQPRWTTVSA